MKSGRTPGVTAIFYPLWTAVAERSGGGPITTCVLSPLGRG